MSNTSNTSVISSQDPSSQLLLEALKINAEANRVNAQTIAHLAVNAPNLPSSSSDPKDRGSQLLEALKINAEITRVSAQTLAHLAYHGPMPSVSAPDPKPAPSPEPKSTAKPAQFVINERVGKITTAEWDALSSERVASLVGVLRGIADDELASLSWEGIGDIIQSRLVGFGFVFLKRGEVTIKSDWAHVKAKGDDKKSIAAAVLDCNRVQTGQHWYTNEMLRVWNRLMEITDA
ncbi:hypothetical protein P167DRAFT_540527 [Morchella conica CCBAS932]|uniref:Uncharacterized protein n=1 Tax=Morchella conica CCBAS932 TaxID=1392247 RepID=A0A3N4K8W0_9PEZI|nr:hypothetical protein P167DRAFT_540527 [Morchella conica CCBAS932]